MKTALIFSHQGDSVWIFHSIHLCKNCSQV